MRKPRVCFISLYAYGYFNPEFGFTGGGAQRQLALLGRALTDEWDVHFIVGDHGQPAREVYDGVTLHRAFAPDSGGDDDSDGDGRSGGNEDNGGLGVGIREKAAWLVTLLRAVRRVDADIYVCREPPDFAAVLFAVCALLGKRWVFNVANDANIDERPDQLGRVRRRIFERGLRHAAAVFAQTDYQAERLAARYDVESVVLPNGYPAAETDATVPHDERDYFLFVGRLHEGQKRPHLFVDLAERLPDHEFLLVGPAGPDPDYHRTLLDRIDGLDNVRAIGAVPPDEVHGYFERAVALVNTSEYEGFPNTFLEAWRVATPVLSLDVDPDRFTRGERVDGFADGEFERLVDHCEALGTDVDRRREQGETGRREFEANFTIDAVAERYGAALRAAIRRA